MLSFDKYQISSIEILFSGSPDEKISLSFFGTCGINRGTCGIKGGYTEVEGKNGKKAIY